MVTAERTNWRLLGAVVLLGLVILWGQASGLPAKTRENTNQTHEICVAQNKSNRAFVHYVDKQIGRARKTLPTFEYYRNHPVELGRQLALLDRQQDELHTQFAPTPC